MRRGTRCEIGTALLVPALALVLVLAIGAAPARAAVRSVSGGIEFTYYAPGAGQVFLSGSFNGWNASELPLTNDGKGTWSIVKKLAPGKYEYKFVVDGAWFADPENPDTVPDPYGGANSLVTVGAAGKLVEATAAAAPRPLANTPLNARVSVSGRYLTRMNFEKNRPFLVDTIPGDPATRVQGEDSRYRLQRPIQKVDLNFYVNVSDLVDSYTRLRLDNTENIIQNNIAAFLDEASINVHPDQFDITGYWNMEIFDLGDPLHLGDDLDLPGTILDDHLKSGKGTTGALITAHPWGFDFQGYFADVYNADYYNDPDLFDNTGEDLFGLRLSKQIGPVELGLPAFLRRDLIWMDFGAIVGGAETGLPHLDEHRARTGDPSTWYETELHDYHYGVDLTHRFNDGHGFIALEWLYGDLRHALVTGNDAGPNNENGSLDVPLLTRSLHVYHGTLDMDLGEAAHLNVRHTTTTMGGAQPDENEILLVFLPESQANKNIFFAVSGSPPLSDTQYSEATLTWEGGDRSHLLWLQRLEQDLDYGPAGGVSPYDSTSTHLKTVSWILSHRTALGRVERSVGRWEMENAFTWADSDQRGPTAHIFETILRCERGLTSRFSLLADVRWIRYDLQQEDVPDFTDEYWAPYGGLRYRPNPKVDVVAAYGVDPFNFDIDYGGRQIGRWWYRQQYLNAHPDATILEAEQDLEDARVFSLRAQFIF